MTTLKPYHGISLLALSSCFCCCFEQGASSEWLGQVKAPGYAEEATYEGEFAFHISYDDGDGEGDANASMTIDRQALETGLTDLKDKYPKHFADLLANNEDAETADVLLQVIALGEVVYG